MTAPEIIITVFGAIAVLCAVLIVCIYSGVGAPPGRHQAHVIPEYDDEPGDEWSPAAEWGDDTPFHAAPTIVTGPVVAPPATPPAGPVTLNLHDRAPKAHTLGPVVELHHPRRDYLRPHIEQAWQTAGENRRQGNWPMHADLTDTGWTRLDQARLNAAIAERELGRFDHIVRYATSGSQARWAS